MKCGLVLLALATAAAQSPAVDPEELLRKAQHRVEQQADVLRNFTCTETVGRAVYRPREKAGVVVNESDPSAPDSGFLLEWTDRLRLELAVFRGRELFSWPGAPEFRSPDFAELVGDEGASTSGEFGPFAISIFLSDVDPVSMHFSGLRTLSGRSAAEYRYQVAQANSHLTVAAGAKGDVASAFEGTALLDSETGDIIRLTVNVPNPPEGSGLRAIHSTLEYGLQHATGQQAWLPVRSDTRMVHDNRAVSINRTEFSACRIFGSESKLDFDEGQQASAAAASPHPKTLVPLPARLVVHTVFRTRIDPAVSFTGDPVEVEVVKPVRSRGKVLIPKGAVVFGRLVRLQRIYFPGRAVVVAIRFSRLEFADSSGRISLGSLGPPPEDPPKGFWDETDAPAEITSFSAKFRLNPGDEWDWMTR